MKAITTGVLTICAALVCCLIGASVIWGVAVEAPTFGWAGALAGLAVAYNFGFRGTGWDRRVIAGIAGVFGLASIGSYVTYQDGKEAHARRVAKSEQEAKKHAEVIEQARLAREKADREEAERAEQKKREAAEMVALRKSNPDEYLTRLKAKDMTMWVEEAKVLRPKLYAAHLEQMKRQSESDEYARQMKSPKEYVSLDMTWSKGGFDSVMVANFTIKSTLQFQVRDISIRCTGFGNSGTQCGKELPRIERGR